MGDGEVNLNLENGDRLNTSCPSLDEYEEQEDDVGVYTAAANDHHNKL